MNCRAGAATISWTILGVPLICTFARLRLRLPFAVDFRRFPTNDCPFFLLGLSWSWVCREKEETVDSVAFAFIISGVPRVFVVLSESCTLCLPLQVSFCAPARVYNFSCFTAVVRCAAPLQPLPLPHPCSAQLFSAFFFHALLASSSSSFFLLLFI